MMACSSRGNEFPVSIGMYVRQMLKAIDKNKKCLSNDHCCTSADNLIIKVAIQNHPEHTNTYLTITK